jgi:Skp family chaperone for outer membrane proteins
MAVLFLLALEFKVGVVNLKECFNPEKYDRIRDIDALLRKEFQKYSDSLMEVKKKIDVLQLKLDGLTREMPLYWEYLGQIKQAETEFEFKKKHGRLQYLQTFNQHQLRVYNEIRRVVALYARDNGFDLVLRVETPSLDPEEDAAPSAAAQIQSRLVLYHSEALDITDDVIQLLKREYLKEKAGALKK